MDKLLTSLSELAAAAGGRLLLALLVLLLGRLMIRSLLRLLDKSRLLTRAEGTVRSFTRSFIKIGLHLLLTVSTIGILGVPMASVITVLASAGVTVGLALQGALSNLAGGVMLMLFRPFRQGDYISAAGVEGTVREVTLFYTVLMTVDNKRITVPNGGLMNATITDSSSEALRRADLCFTCARGEAPARVQALLRETVLADARVLPQPELFARLTGVTDRALEFTVRAWCRSEDYWALYYDLTQRITETMAEHRIPSPAVRVTTDAPSGKEGTSQ